MKINNTNNINFTSHYVKDVRILKETETGDLKTYNAKLVEFDIDKDKTKINEICKTDEFYAFGDQLFDDLYNKSLYSRVVENRRCYGLVENTEKDFTNIDKDKLLGIYTLYETSNEDIPLSLPYFMTNEKYRNEYYDSDSKYKKIGESMFNSITELYPDKAIYGYTALASLGFWGKMGFEHLSKRRLVYIPPTQKGKINIDKYKSW